MNAGRIEQEGSPEDVYQRPRTLTNDEAALN